MTVKKAARVRCGVCKSFVRRDVEVVLVFRAFSSRQNRYREETTAVYPCKRCLEQARSVYKKAYYELSEMVRDDWG